MKMNIEIEFLLIPFIDKSKAPLAPIRYDLWFPPAHCTLASFVFSLSQKVMIPVAFFPLTWSWLLHIQSRPLRTNKPILQFSVVTSGGPRYEQIYEDLLFYLLHALILYFGLWSYAKFSVHTTFSWTTGVDVALLSASTATMVFPTSTACVGTHNRPVGWTLCTSPTAITTAQIMRKSFAKTPILAFKIIIMFGRDWPIAI